MDEKSKKLVSEVLTSVLVGASIYLVISACSWLTGLVIPVPGTLILIFLLSLSIEVKVMHKKIN